MQKNNTHVVAYSGIEKGVIIYIPNGDGSNFEFLKNNKFTNIKYKGIENYDTEELKGEYHLIAFNLVDKNYDELINSFEKILNEEKEEKKYDDSLHEIIDFFQKFSNSIKLETLHGDMAEALFVKKCIDLKIKNLLEKDYIRKNEFDKFDFVFKNNQILEIKSTSKFLSEIKINLSQSKINDENVNIIVVKNIFYNAKISNEYYSIIDILNYLDERSLLCPLFKEKLSFYMNDDIALKCFININETEWAFFDKDFLPIIEIKKDGALKSLTCNLDATTSLYKKDEFNKMIVEIAKK